MLRGFTDSRGVEWRVWDVFPSAGTTESTADTLSRSTLKDTVFASGWLCFESQSEKRRLAPIPLGWDIGGEQRLEQLRDTATPVRFRQHGQRAS